jgi:tetratricopeptide (TPR) repeat protein
MRNLDLEEFMTAYNIRQAAILKETTPLMSGYWKRVNNSSQEIPMSVFTTCELSYQQLLNLEKTDHRNLQDLLTMLAFFDSRDIPEVLIKAYSQRNWVTHDYTACTEKSETCTELKPFDSFLTGPGSFLHQQEKEWDSASFHEALLVLRRLSLAEFSLASSKMDSIHVSLHPLIRDWLRMRTPMDQCPKYSSLAATCIYKFLASTRDWAAYQMTLSEKQQLIGHINAIAANIAEFGDGQPLESVEIPIYERDCHRGAPAYEFSKLMYQNGQYKAAEEWSRRSLTQRRHHLGPEAPETLTTLSSLAAALYSQGGFSEAKQIYNHVIEIKNRTLGSNHPETLLSKLNLTPLLTSEGEHETAETIYRSVLEFYKLKLGELDPNTIITMGGLGSLLNIVGRYEEAEKLNHRALAMAKIIFGASHHRTLTIMDFFGVSLMGLGEPAEAENILQEALWLRERESGMEHPDTLMCISHLATALKLQRKHVAGRMLQARLLGTEREARRIVAQSTERFWFDFIHHPSIQNTRLYRPKLWCMYADTL